MTTRHGEVQEWIAHYTARPPQNGCIWWPFSVTNTGHARAWSPRTKRIDSAYRVVWEAVYGVPFPAPEACHSCGNGHLGCVNHRHVDPGNHQDNMADRREDGRDAIGSAHGRAVLDEADVAQICERLAAGHPSRRIAAEFGISATTIGEIWRGEKWTHVAASRLADTTRACEECGTPLPSSRQAGKRYCGRTCINRVSGRRRAERQRQAKPSSPAWPAAGPATPT
jgi:hypothetical protein